MGSAEFATASKHFPTGYTTGEETCQRGVLVPQVPDIFLLLTDKGLEGVDELEESRRGDLGIELGGASGRDRAREGWPK